MTFLSDDAHARALEAEARIWEDAPPRSEEQELLRVLRQADLVDHRLSELSGILLGLRMAQSPQGGEAPLAAWLEACPELHGHWPASGIRSALEDVAARGQDYDPKRDPQDRRTRALARKRIRSARGALIRRATLMEAAPDIECDDPVPEVLFQGRIFVFTGIFSVMVRKLAEEVTKALGGELRDVAVQKADYLVIGTRSHPAWKRSSRGRKIEAFERWRRLKKTDCRIVSESTWARAVLSKAKGGGGPSPASQPQPPSIPEGQSPHSGPAFGEPRP